MNYNECIRLALSDVNERKRNGKYFPLGLNNIIKAWLSHSRQPH